MKGDTTMTLYQKWQSYADNTKMSQQDFQEFWGAYFDREKGMYEKLLKTNEVIQGTVADLAEMFGVDIMTMVGFLEGINDSLNTPNDVKNVEETSVVALDWNKEKLYRNMVAAKADWLYNLPEWEAHLTEEERQELYRVQKKSTTIVKGKKVGRNDPCPCGSGLKYKKCCGKNA